MRHLLLLACLTGILIQGNSYSTSAGRTMKIEIREQWKFKEEQIGAWHPAEVPGCVHTDLMKNNLIPDPFVGLHERSLQWIGEKNWIYETTFDVPSEVLQNDVVELVFTGLDTYAEVTLNDSLLLKTNNMFRTWRVNCQSVVRERGNLLRVRFRNVFDETLPKYKSAPFELQAFANNDQADVKISMYSRKAQFHFGWDWGPRLITCGLWRPVFLEAWSGFKINDVHVQQKNVNRSGANICSVIRIHSQKEQTVTASVRMDSVLICSEQIQLTPGIHQVTLAGLVQNPELWWTNGLGGQKRYAYQLDIKDDSGCRDSYSAEIGIRSIEVIREKDSMGRCLAIRLNGVPVFMKGANYIPQDNFQDRVTEKRYEQIIRSAAEANMNMLRVWGGGIYEDDRFYDLCDRYGILVWQEMIFACAMYPGDKDFFENVRQEVIDNVTRLRNHACIALYCGNNENEIAWNQWNWKEKYNRKTQKQFEKSAEELFYSVIPSALREADSIRYYHPTSPSAGFKDIDAGDGDIHYWGVWHGKEPFEQYPSHLARFVSEYGFQSYPERSTIARYARPEEMTLHSDVMLSHQRCMADERRDKEYGNRLIQWYMDRWYRTPKDFESYIYVSQVLQAEGVKVAMEAHRRAMPYCMGSLYWQINDCWPVASWSSIDYYGRWKALHYIVKKSYASILLSPVISGDTGVIHIVSDSMDTFPAELEFSILDFDGAVIARRMLPVTVQANSAQKGAEFSLSQFAPDADPSRSVLVCRLKNNGAVRAECIFYFKTPRKLSLKRPAFSPVITKTASGYTVEITTTSLAKNVYLTCSDTESFFDDNYFDLIPGIPKSVTVTTTLSLEEFKRSIKIRSLIDSYEEE